MARVERRTRVTIYQTLNGQEEEIAHIDGLQGHLPDVAIRTNAVDENGPRFQIFTSLTSDTLMEIAEEVARISTPGGKK